MLAVAVPVAVLAAFMQLHVPAGWTATAAAAAAGAPLLTTAARQVRNQATARKQLLAAHLRLWSNATGVPIARDIADPVVIGVKPATTESDRLIPWNPPYIRRDVDERLEGALAFNQFVLIVGDSASGKSRTAFELLRRRYADRAVIVPKHPASLSTLLNAGIEFRQAVVWLDDLDAYLGTGEFTLADLERLVSSGRHDINVIATIRKAAYERFDQDAAISERKLLRAAAQLPLRRQLSYGERSRAEDAANDDPTLGSVLDRLMNDSHSYGLAEYLAAAPELIRRFDYGDDINSMPLGVALVRAAIDWRRVGITRPILQEALFALCPLYVPFDYGPLIDDQALEEALQWATKKVVATSALLTEEPNGYRVFDYLLDYVETEARFLVPPKLLDGLSKLVRQEEMPRVALALREIYRQTGQDAALTAGHGMNVHAIAATPDSGRNGLGRELLQTSERAPDDPVAAMLSARGFLLPPDIANFTGRTDVVEHAIDALTCGAARVLTMSGLGGVGKTATAIHLAHRLRHQEAFDDVGAYVRLRDQDGIGMSPDDVLADVAAAFGVPGHDLRAADLNGLVTLYRGALARRKMVFVLDDAVSQEQVMPLLPPAPSVAIVTTRFELHLEDADRMVLDPLTAEEAVLMLRSIVGPERVENDSAGVEAIMQMIGDLPLAIRIIGARLREDSAVSMTKMAAELRDDYQTSLDNLASRGMAVRSSFNLSYSRLPPQQALAFRLLALAPREGFTVKQAVALLGGSEVEVGQILLDLANASLLREVPPDRYEMHELLRVFARELSQESDAESVRRDALQRFAGL